MALFDTPGSGQEHAGGGLRQIFEAAKPALNLSADQEQKIKNIFKEFREERNELKNTGGDNMTNDIHSARKDAKQQLMEVLNDDQKKIVIQHLSEWRNESKQ